MPKKQPKNAYFFFMLEYKKYQEVSGRRFPGGMKEVAEYAAEPWKKLAPHEKKRYENMAKSHKEHDKKYGERYTSQGKAISELQKEELEKKKKIENQKKAVCKLIDDAVAYEKLDTTIFYILSFNYFTKETAQSRYYPCELGLVQFSIKNGITKKFHKLLNPGPLPLGHAFLAKDHGDKTHQLPVPPKALGEPEFDLVLSEMIELFVNERSGLDQTFYVFAMEQEMEMVESIVHDFCEIGQIETDAIQILPLTFLFQKLRAAVDKVFLEIESEFTFAIAQAHLERDNYQYYVGHGCKLHEIEDVNIHCALSRPTRWAYYIIDQTIGVTGGKKRVGFHYPKGCEIEGGDDDDDDSDDEIDENVKVKMQNEQEDESRYDDDLSELKKEKNEFSDDDETVDRKLNNSFDFEANVRKFESDTQNDTDSLSEASTRYNQRPKASDRRYFYDNDTESSVTFTSDTQSENKRMNNNHQTYASSLGQTTIRSTNPFHEDNFPALGAIPKTNRRQNASYYRLASSDSDSSSRQPSAHKRQAYDRSN